MRVSHVRTTNQCDLYRRIASRFAAGTGAFLFAGAMIGASALAGPAALGSALRGEGLAYTAPSHLSQDDSDSGDSDEKEVANSDLQKYINVYKAMQRDHNMTVEQATAKEGMTVASFRSLEDRIERDDTLRERVRKELQAAAQHSPASKESKALH